MIRAAKRASILPLIGLIALSAYILACRPGFSPDGSQVVYPVLDEKTNSFRIVVYDLKQKKNTTLFVGQEKRNGDSGATTLWTEDGKSIVAAWVDAEDDQLFHLFTLPLDIRKMKRAQRVRVQEEAAGSLLYPMVNRGPFLYLSGDPVLKIDLRNGAVTRPAAGVPTILAVGGKKIHCITKIDEADEAYEVGVLDPEALTQTVSFRSKPEIHPFFAVSSDESRYLLLRTQSTIVAPATETEPEKRTARTDLIVIHDGKEERSIPMPKNGEYGNLVWTHDSKTAYVAHTKEGGDDCLEVLRVELAKGEIKPILRIDGCDQEQMLLFQLSLSPDGTMLAGSLAQAESKDVKPEDRVLWLIDISGEEPKITKVAPPKS